MSTAAESSEGAPSRAKSAWKAWVLGPAIVGAAVGFIVATRIPPLYRSTALLLVGPQLVPEAYVRSTTKINDRLQTILPGVLSRTRLEQIIREFNLYQQDQRSALTLEVVENMRRHIELNAEQGDGVRISFVGTEPTTVMKVTQRLTALFIEENARTQELIADDTNQFLESSLEQVRRHLVWQDQRLRDARRKADPEAETLAIEYDVLKTTFKDLSSKIEESRLAAALQRRPIGETLRLVDTAEVPAQPFSPDRRIYTAIGAATGLAAGLCLFFAWPRDLFRKKRSGVAAPAEA